MTRGSTAPIARLIAPNPAATHQRLPRAQLNQGERDRRNRGDDLADRRDVVEEVCEQAPKERNVHAPPPAPDEHQDAREEAHHGLGDQVGVDLVRRRRKVLDLAWGGDLGELLAEPGRLEEHEGDDQQDEDHLRHEGGRGLGHRGREIQHPGRLGEVVDRLEVDAVAGEPELELLHLAGEHRRVLGDSLGERPDRSRERKAESSAGGDVQQEPRQDRCESGYAPIAQPHHERCRDDGDESGDEHWNQQGRGELDARLRSR